MATKNDLMKELNKIGIALSAEKDTNKLLQLILEESIKITNSDGGSLYIKEIIDKEEKLKFKITKNFSREFPFKEFTLPLNKKSISGYVGLTGETLNIKNVNNIDSLLKITYNNSFDKSINYKTINMLVIPMKDYSGDVVGVLQLLNKKKEEGTVLGEPDTIEKNIISYTRDEEEIITSLASQAAILLERTRLYNEIEELFQSFIEAMVSTLDARDTTTSGHSRRLAGYAIELAKAIDRIDYGPYKDKTFNKDEIRQLYYAALLHDIGKVGIKENILLKRNRLTDDRMETIKYRFQYFKKNLELRKVLHRLSDYETELLLKIDKYYEIISDINKKGFVTVDEENMISKISMVEFIDVDGTNRNLLDEFEIENLMIKKGNLTDEERREMNLHVTFTYDILEGIKWTKLLKRIPEIASGHHEKIDGSGYPHGLVGDEIPFEAKLLAILDIFEALTARDRPYKPPMAVEKALKILEFEVKDNHLDKYIFEIFVKEKIYELYKKELNKIVII
ncbi:HD family phosphohydrolase [Haliovirga abyssi]|uniref:HD family phosphohydrolase n=1 Tax=Haliovirga abyssi TaxID=2996794 RepID=A0AAU9DL75_9FUSO|nr:HD family phosphohydrolase [Haliovirga abyssi]BDU50682.1 HD family phosphohydrolase [Haliovirga abyssi]